MINRKSLRLMYSILTQQQRLRKAGNNRFWLLFLISVLSVVATTAQTQVVSEQKPYSIFQHLESIDRSAAFIVAEHQVTGFLDQRNAVEQLREIFPGQSKQDAAWAIKAKSFLRRLSEGSADKIHIELKASSEINHLWAAFTPQGVDGRPTIFINAQLLQRAKPDEINKILLEEIGHWIDFEINGEMDSPGDEGQYFATKLVFGNMDEAFKAQLLAENDFLKLSIDGQTYETELASILFTTSAAYNIWTSATQNTTQLETNIVYVQSRLGIASDRILFISVPEADPIFSGNNTRGWLYVVAADNTV